MKVKVNQDLCIGCGLCASESVAASVFEMNETDYKAVVKDGADLQANKEKIKEAIEMCPVVAIKMVE